MTTRIPLAVTVVGALLIGGAATGTTRASWTDQATQVGDSITTGRLSYTASNPGAVTVEKVAGSSADSTFALADTSLGKNIAQRTTVTIGSVPAGLSATIGTSCAGAATSASVDTTPASAPRTLCVRVTVTNASTAASGNVVVNLSSAQRPTAGWSTTTTQRTVAVTVNQPAAPSAPTLNCLPGRQNNNDFTFSWSAVAGATSYTVFRSTTSNTDSAFQPIATKSGSPVPTSHPLTNVPDPSTHYYRVKATTSAGTSGFSKTLTLTRSGNGSSNFTCGVAP